MSVTAALVWSFFRDRRNERQLADSMKGIATTVAERWQDGDERDKQMLHLTGEVEKMTRWLVRLTVASSTVAVVSLVVAVLALTQT
jgi:uncharacterized coiled-coil protein SlyX